MKSVIGSFGVLAALIIALILGPFPLTWETTLVEVILVMTLVPRLRALDARVMSTASSSMCQTDSRSKV